MAFAPPNYAVGVYRDGSDGGQLHLTPIHEVLQMRPSFEHHRPKGDSKDDVEEDEDKPKKVKQEPTSVTVQVKKEMTERQTEYKLNSHQYQRQLAESEPWQHLKFYDELRPESQEVFDKLFVHRASALDFDVKPHNYLNLLTKAGSARGVDFEDKDGAEAARENQSPMRCLMKLKPETWIKSILKLSQTMAPWRLFALAEEAQLSSDLKQFVEQVGTVAVLVRGSWVLRSEFFYESGPEYLIEARDAVIRAFSEERFILREKLCGGYAAAKRIDPATLSSILEQLAFRRPNPVTGPILPNGERASDDTAGPRPQSWEFKIADDVEMSKKYPALARELSAGGSKWLTARAEKPVGTSNGEEASASKDTLTGECREYLVQLLDNEGKWLNLEECALKFEQSVADAPVGIQEELEDVCGPKTVEKALNEIAVCVQGVYVIRGIPPSLGTRSKAENQHAKYWDVLIKAFSRKKMMKKTEINVICEETIGEKEIPQAAYTKFIKRFAVNKGASWTFRQGMKW